MDKNLEGAVSSVSAAGRERRVWDGRTLKMVPKMGQQALQ